MPSRAKSPGRKSKSALRSFFDSIDVDGSGYIDANELKRASAQLGFGNLTDHEIAALLAEADTDNDGEIDFDEFQSIVLSAKGTSSKWANASAGALVWKRYNSMLDAGEELLAPLHKAATNTCEKNEEGVYIPGGSRICALPSGSIVGSLIMVPIGAAIGAVVGASYIPLIENTVWGREELQAEMVAAIGLASTVVGLLFMVLSLGFFFGRSQGHFGHYLWGFKVVDAETHENASTTSLWARAFLVNPSVFTGALNVIVGNHAHSIPEVIQQQIRTGTLPKLVLFHLVLFGLSGIIQMINGIMVLASKDSRHIFDRILGHQVIATQKLVKKGK